MSHLISIEIDRELAERLQMFFDTGSLNVLDADDADEALRCITEALEQDDAVDE